MRYLLALICPPAALLACHRPWQSLVVLLLWVVGLATTGWGVGLLLLFASILWASNGVGDERAAQESARFVRSVTPIPTVRD